MTTPDTFEVSMDVQAPRTLCPAGTHPVVCVDGIHLGHTVEQYKDNPPKLVQKYVLVFQTRAINPDTGRRFELSREFTASMHENAGLRKFLGQWRGRAYTDAEAVNVKLHMTVGFPGLATVEHRASQSTGKVYANLTNIMPLPEGMTALAPEDYTRAEWWETKKGEYKAKAEAYLAMQEAQKAGAAAVANRTPEQSVAAMVAAGDASSADLPF
jgi:hypothetical protein